MDRERFSFQVVLIFYKFLKYVIIAETNFKRSGHVTLVKISLSPNGFQHFKEKMAGNRKDIKSF